MMSANWMNMRDTTIYIVIAYIMDMIACMSVILFYSQVFSTQVICDPAERGCNFQTAFLHSKVGPGVVFILISAMIRGWTFTVFRLLGGQLEFRSPDFLSNLQSVLKGLQTETYEQLTSNDHEDR